jgi:hypothetical protein
LQWTLGLSWEKIGWGMVVTTLLIVAGCVGVGAILLPPHCAQISVLWVTFTLFLLKDMVSHSRRLYVIMKKFATFL